MGRIDGVVVVLCVLVSAGAGAQPAAELASTPSLLPDAAGLVSALFEDWRWRLFGDDDGVSARAVTALWEDEDRFVYAAAADGVYRYDLYRWERAVFEGAPPEGPVRRFVETQGAVYAATERSLWRVEPGSTLRRVFPDEGLSDAVAGTIVVAASDRDTAFFVHEPADGRRKEHFQIRGRRIEPLDPGVLLPSGSLRDYRVDDERTHWLVTDLGLLHYRGPDENRWIELESWDIGLEFDDPVCRRLISFRKPPTRELGVDEPKQKRLARRVLWGLFHPRGQPERWVLARRDDEVWKVLGRQILVGSRAPVEHVVQDLGHNHYATCEDGSLYVLPNGGEEWVPVRWPEGASRLLHGGMRDGDGAVWFRPRVGGVALFDVESRRWERLPGVPGVEYPEVRVLLESSDRRLWVGTSTGVLRYSRAESPGAAGWRLEEMRGRVRGAELSGITGLAEDSQGNIWVSSAESFPGAFFHDGSAWTAPAELAGFSDAPIRRVVADRLRELWFLPEHRDRRRPVIFRRSALTGYRIEAVEIDGFRGRSILNDLARTADDVVWIAADEGLLECVLVGDRLELRRLLTSRDGLAAQRPWAVALAPDGALWLSYWSAGSGVTRILGDEVRSFGVEDGLGSGYVLTVVSDGFDLWFGTQAGLSRYDGECWYSFPVASQGPRASWVFTILSAGTTRRGRELLLGTLGDGVWRFTTDDVERPAFTSVRFPERGRSDGSIELGWEARDYKNETPPSFLQYRHRLDGGAWSSFAPETSLRLSGLADGVHEVEVEVRDLDGNANREHLTRRFRIGSEIPLWPAWAALGGVGLVALATLLRGARRRLRARREELRRYRGVFRGYPGAVLLVDAQGRVADYNGVDGELLGVDGLERSEVVGRSARLLPGLAAVDWEDLLGRARAGERVTRSVPAVGAAPRSRGALTLGVRAFAHGGPAGSQRGSEVPDVVVVVEDRSVDRAIELRRRRDARLEALREFARRLEARLDASARELAGRGGDAGDSLAADRRGVRRALEALSGPHPCPGDGAICDLGSVVERLLRVGGGESPGSSAESAPVRFDREVRVDFRGHLGLWPVEAPAALLEEIVRPLLQNAADALQGGGTLRVRTANARVDGDIPGLMPGPYVELVVEDDGPGVDPAVLDAVFDPLFTTKAAGRAEGLGLSLALAATRALGGELHLSSHPGAGTTVSVWIPARRG